MPSAMRALQLLVVICGATCISAPAIAQLIPAVDSLRHALATAEREARVDVLAELSWTYRMIDADSARRYGLDALALAERLDYTRGLAAAHNNLGVAFEAQGNYEEALQHHRQALVYKTALGDSLEVANTFNNIGIVLDEQGRYNEALDQYHEALPIYQALDDRSHIAMTLVNIAIVHKRQKDFDLVFSNYERALALYIELENAFGQAACYANMGSALLETGDYERSISFSERAADEFEKLDVRQFVPVSVVNVGIAYLRLERFGEAESTLRRGLSLSEAYNDRKQTAYTRRHLAELYLQQGRAADALAEARLSLAVAREIQAREEVKEAYRLLAESHAALNDFPQALAFHRRFVALNDSLYEIEKARQIAELRTIYETKEKEQQIQTLEQAGQLQFVALQRNRVLAGGLGASLMLLVLLGLVWQKRTALARQHDLDRQALELKEAQIGAVIAAQEAERKRIARDLHDGVGQQIGGLKMAWQHLSGQLSLQAPALVPHLDELAHILDETGAEVRSLSHQMLPRALHQLGLRAALDDMLRNSFAHTDIACTFDSFDIGDRRYDETVEVGLYRIAQELVANILKHSGAGHVVVQLYQTGEHLVLRIEDDGRGMDASRSAAGHGLANIESRLGLLRGQLNLDADLPRGVTATIRIPTA